MVLSLIIILLSVVTGFTAPNDRISIGLDIYNRDQALVREIRHVDLNKGVNHIDFRQISPSIYGHTAFVTPLKHEKHLTLLSLSYRYELFDPEKYLSNRLGKWVSLDIDDELVEGILVYFNEFDLFLQRDSTSKTITVSDRGDITEYDSLLPGVVMTPTLRWEVESSKNLTDLPVELSYLTDDIAWTCDYRAELVKDDEIRLSGFFSLDNGLMVDFPQAEIALIAGKSHRSNDKIKGEVSADPGSGAKPDKQERLFEFYRYPIERKIDLMGDMTMQIPFFSLDEVEVERRFIVPHILEGDEVRTKLRFLNDRASGIGKPLPAGDIGVYRRTDGKSLSFIGEDRIPATPVGSMVEIDVGTAFDLTARRIRLAQARPERNRHEETWQVELSSGRSEDATVYVEQRVFGYYDLTRAEVNGNPIEHEVKAANLLIFPVKVPAGENAKLSFTLTYGY